MGIRGSSTHADCGCTIRFGMVCLPSKSLQSRDFILAQYKKEAFSHFTLIAIEAALQAGDILREGYGTAFSIQKKTGRHNLVTEYDHLAEKSILSFLQAHVPNSHFLAEESGSTGTHSDILWVIDPLDGTVNYAHQIPVFSISIALELNGDLFCGVVYQPITHELFVAEKGKGAFLNGKTLQVSQVEKIEDSILSTGFPYNLQENPFDCIDHFVDILHLGLPIRRMGSAAIDLAYTAAGRFDGFFEVGLSAWDCAAGILLVQESGGKISTWDQKPLNYRVKDPIVCSNGKIHTPLCNILNRPIVR
jgi:myo-inositol-1(or 4)-monophosphatase